MFPIKSFCLFTLIVSASFPAFGQVGWVGQDGIYRPPPAPGANQVQPYVPPSNASSYGGYQPQTPYVPPSNASSYQLAPQPTYQPPTNASSYPPASPFRPQPNQFQR
jgi:hypothetical protein